MTKKTKLSFETRMNILLTPCQTKQELSNFIQFHLGLSLPDQIVSRYSDSNPMDIIWEIYRICVLKQNSDNIDEFLIVAGRGSGKCQIKGTKILTKNGLKNIEDVQIGDTVYTGWSWDTVKVTYDEGIKDAFGIKTQLLSKETPFDNVGSYNHRIQAIQEDGSIGWKYLRDLQVGDIVYKSAYCDFNVNTNSKQYIDGWIIGVLLGDGAINRHNCNQITLCSSDFEMLRFYAEEVYLRFGIKARVKRNSKRSVNLSISSSDFKSWFHSYVDGELAYYKKLKTIAHSPDFLAGLIAGLMDTDGSKESITLANKELIYQIGQILNGFGVAVAIDNERRPPRFSQFIKADASYHECIFKTKLHDFLLPLFAKRDSFIAHRNHMNEQFRYPNCLLRPFVNFIKEELQADNGWVTIKGDRIRHAVPYAKALYGQLNKANNHIYGHKIVALKDFFTSLGYQGQVDKLDFILRGYYETVSSVTHNQAYFYDLEMESVHSYWSNGFISHNTLSMAIVELLMVLHDQRDVVHVGAILSQAERCYNYIKGFLYAPRLKSLFMPSKVPEDQRMLEKSNMSKSIFNVKDQKITLEVIPATLKATNGPHSPFICVDEIDTVSGEGLRAFKEISGMLDTKGGKRALRVGISTRKSRYGLMNRQLENAEKDGRHVRRWTALEFTERCPDERSGTDPVLLYVMQNNMQAIPEVEYLQKAPAKQKEFVPYTLPGSGCAQCPAAAVCLGDAKKQCSKSVMLKPIKEFINKIKVEGADWALAQLMNLKPSVEGIVFREFEEQSHVKTWNEMWKILTGGEFPGECTHDLFVAKCHDMRLLALSGVDWGWSNPNTVVYLFIDKRENVYVVRCDGMTYVSQPTWIHYLRTKHQPVYHAQLYFPDIADQGAIDEMKKAGLPAANNVDKSINTGIQVIKKFLRVPGTQEAKIFFAKETCQSLIEEFSMYHYKTDTAGISTDMPDDANNHWLDALRYIMTMTFGKTLMLMSGGSEMDEVAQVTDQKGDFLKMPTPAEFAHRQGLNIETTVDTSKLGRLENQKDPDDSDDDGGDDTGGTNFLWTIG